MVGLRIKPGVCIELTLRYGAHWDPFLSCEHVWAERGSEPRRKLGKDIFSLFFLKNEFSQDESTLFKISMTLRLLSAFLRLRLRVLILNCWVSAYWRYLRLLLRSCLFLFISNKKVNRKGGGWLSVKVHHEGRCDYIYIFTTVLPGRVWVVLQLTSSLHLGIMNHFIGPPSNFPGDDRTRCNTNILLTGCSHMLIGGT